MQVKRGEIWIAKFSGTGSEQSGTRPGIIVSNSANNLYSPTINIIPVTTQGKNKLPVHVIVGTDSGLIKRSTALVEQEATLDKGKLVRKVGNCSYETIEEINRAILIQKGIIKPFADRKYLQKLYEKIEEINYFISDCIKKQRDYDNELTEKSFIMADLISYCRQHKIDYKKYIPNNNINQRRIELKEVL